MACTHVPLGALSWTQGAHPLEKKKIGDAPGIALLEFAPGFEDPNWCRRAHVIYVLRGALTLMLENGWVRIAAGESCIVDGGTGHRARNEGDVPVELFIYSPPS